MINTSDLSIPSIMVNRFFARVDDINNCVRISFAEAFDSENKVDNFHVAISMSKENAKLFIKYIESTLNPPKETRQQKRSKIV